MSTSSKTPIDVEKGSDPYEGPVAVDPGVYSGEHDAAKPVDGMWAKFDYYNRKLERKIGIETVSEENLVGRVLSC